MMRDAKGLVASTRRVRGHLSQVGIVLVEVIGDCVGI